MQTCSRPYDLAKGIALKPKLWLATAVSVVLAVGSAQAAPSFPSAPHVRGAIHIHAYRGGWGHHHGWGWGPLAWLGLGAGIVASAISGQHLLVTPTDARAFANS